MINKWLLGLLISLWLIPSQSVPAIETENALKAGFLFNFARYSEWSRAQDTQTEFVLCSPDKHFIDVASAVLAKRMVNHLPIHSIIVNLTETDLSQCQVLFITSDTLSLWQSAELTPLNNIMVVGETEDFIEQGGHIRFFLSGGKIRFEVSPAKLTQANINMSSKVLRLGRVVDN